MTDQFRGMNCRRVGNSGLRVSEIGLGLWKWGEPPADESSVGNHAGFDILDRALELGIFFWDTACSYNGGSGNSERLLGRYFASRPKWARDQVVLATKVSNPVYPYRAETTEFTPNQRGASRLYILRMVDDCLRRLHTDRIDVLYLHKPNVNAETGDYDTPLDETWSTISDLIAAGKVCYAAVSNYSSRQIAEAQAAFSEVGADGSRRIIAVQNRYNLIERGEVSCSGGAQTEAAFLDFCAAERVSVIPYFPLASGVLTGRYRKDNLATVQGRIIAEKRQQRMLKDANLTAVERLTPLAERKGCTLAQLAISWLLAHPQVASVIAGVTRKEQLEDNARAPLTRLAAEDVSEIDSILRECNLIQQ